MKKYLKIKDENSTEFIERFNNALDKMISVYGISREEADKYNGELITFIEGFLGTDADAKDKKTKFFKVGEKVKLINEGEGNDFNVEITKLFRDIESGEWLYSVKPLDFKGFEIEVLRSNCYKDDE